MLYVAAMKKANSKLRIIRKGLRIRLLIRWIQEANIIMALNRLIVWPQLKYFLLIRSPENVFERKVQ